MFISGILRTTSRNLQSRPASSRGWENRRNTMPIWNGQIPFSITLEHARAGRKDRAQRLQQPIDHSLQTKRGQKQGLHPPPACHSGRDVIPTLYPQHTPQLPLEEAEMMSASTMVSVAPQMLYSWVPANPNLTPISTGTLSGEGISKYFRVSRDTESCCRGYQS